MANVPTQSKTDTAQDVVMDTVQNPTLFTTYSKTDLDDAVTAFLGGMDMKEVRAKYPQIPERTIYGRAASKRKHTKPKKPGPPPALGSEQEQELAEWILSQKSQGKRLTRDMVRKRASEMLNAKMNGNVTPSNSQQGSSGESSSNAKTDNVSASSSSPASSESATKPEELLLGLGWFNRFMRRHPEVSLRYSNGQTSGKSSRSASNERRGTKYNKNHQRNGQSGDTDETFASAPNMYDSTPDEQGEVPTPTRHHASGNKRKHRHSKSSSRSPSPNNASPITPNSRDNYTNRDTSPGAKSHPATARRRKQTNVPMIPRGGASNGSNARLSAEFPGRSMYNEEGWSRRYGNQRSNHESEYHSLELEKLRCEVEERRIRLCVERALARKTLIEAGLSPEEADKVLSNDDKGR